MARGPAFNMLLVTDRDEQLAQPGEVTSLDGDLEEAWLPVRCEGCQTIVLALGRQRGRADPDLTATSHQAECPDCGRTIRAEVEHLQDQYRTWQPLVPDEVENGEPVHLDDLRDGVHERG